jgi:predicted dehydrogenase
LHLIKSNSLGRIVEFETHFDRHRPEASGGWKTTPGPGRGVVYDLGSHLIDQVVYTFGLPKRITGFVGSQREHNPTGNEDSCTVLLHYDGMMATVKAGVISLEAAQLRFWIRGQDGSYKKVRSSHIFSNPKLDLLTET